MGFGPTTTYHELFLSLRISSMRLEVVVFFYFIITEIVLTSFWIVPQKLKIAVEAPYSRFGTCFWVWLIFYSHKLKTRQNGLFWNQDDFRALYGKYENRPISVFWNQGDFGQLDIQLCIILKTGWFRKSPKTKTVWFQLKFEIDLISAILKHKKSHGSKIPWLICFCLSVAKFGALNRVLN